MKAFKKWWKSEVDNGCEQGCEYGAKNAFQAALKEVLEQCHHHQSQDVIDWILEELKED